MMKPRGRLARSVLVFAATAGLVANFALPAAAQDRRFGEGRGAERGPHNGAARGVEGGRPVAYGNHGGAGYNGRAAADPHWHGSDFHPGRGHAGWGPGHGGGPAHGWGPGYDWGPGYGWGWSIGGWGVGGWGVGGWGWGASWSWNGVVVVGGPAALFATPLIVFAPPPIYVAPPPIVLGLPAPPAVEATPPPSAAPPPIASTLPLPPEELLLAAAPPPIVILPPPEIIVAAAPPTLFFAPPFLAFASFGVGGWGWGGWAWGGHGWAWHEHASHGWVAHDPGPRAWQSRGWGLALRRLRAWPPMGARAGWRRRDALRRAPLWRERRWPILRCAPRGIWTAMIRFADPTPPVFRRRPSSVLWNGSFR